MIDATFGRGLRDALKSLFLLAEQKPIEAVVTFVVSRSRPLKGMPMANPVEISIDEKVAVAVAITDRAGNAAKVDGVPTWSAAPDTAVTLAVADDGLSAEITANDGTPQAVLVTLNGDADLGDGVKPIIGTLQVNITAGEAQFLTLDAGAPEPK